MRTAIASILTFASILVVVPATARADSDFIAAASRCGNVPAGQQDECRRCVDVQTMVRTGIARHYWPAWPAAERCIDARASGQRLQSHARPPAGGSSVSNDTSPPAVDARANAVVLTPSRCDRLFSGAQRDECRRCAELPRGRYHQYEPAGARCRDGSGGVIAAGGGGSGAGAAASAGDDPRGDTRENATIYTSTRCRRALSGALSAECQSCVDRAGSNRFHQYQPAGLRCRTSRNEIVGQ